MVKKFGVNSLGNLAILYKVNVKFVMQARTTRVRSCVEDSHVLVKKWLIPGLISGNLAIWTVLVLEKVLF